MAHPFLWDWQMCTVERCRFICKWYLDNEPSTRKFWTKKELENHLRKIENKIIRRELLAMLHKIHGRAVCYAR